MSRAARSVAMPEAVEQTARQHLLRADRQEDLCFAFWHPSSGVTRQTALVQQLILPLPGERHVHGNASFEPHYFERALRAAAREGAGLALMHSHPLGRNWQGMSTDDINTEQGRAGAAFGATRLPLLGLTIAGDGNWSGRFWEREAARRYARNDCATVRVVGERLRVTYMDALAPPPRTGETQIRTVSSWGERKQADLTRLRVGVVGCGSVGGFIAEALARTGVQDPVFIDYDRIETKNLDRLLFGTRGNVGQYKVLALVEHLRQRATADSFSGLPVLAAVYEEAGFRAALDCDVLFSCVDRPWGRHVLNLIAYAHLIPVIDGGILVRKNRRDELAAASWRAHTVTVGHRCLECIGQYDSGMVQVERDGYLDDPTYIEGLAKDHPLRARENVFAFSMACASLQMLQMLAMVIDPLGRSNPGEQLYHFVGGFMEPATPTTCQSECIFPQMVALGDHCGFTVTGDRPPQLRRGSELPSPPASMIRRALGKATTFFASLFRTRFRK
jgi:molybdopterin-synthase adenylyltransferase